MASSIGHNKSYPRGKEMDVIIHVFRIFEIQFRSGVMAAEVGFYCRFGKSS